MFLASGGQKRPEILGRVIHTGKRRYIKINRRMITTRRFLYSIVMAFFVRERRVIV